MTTTARPRARGFSLIEVMISSALFFVGLEAVFTAYHTAASMLAHHRALTGAISIAEGTLEELVQRYPGDPLIAMGPHAPADRRYDRNGALAVAVGAMYTASWTVKPYAKLNAVREISVTLAWVEATQPKSLVLTTWRH